MLNMVLGRHDLGSFGVMNSHGKVRFMLKIEKGRPNALHAGCVGQDGLRNFGDFSSTSIGEHLADFLDLSPTIIVLDRYLMNHSRRSSQVIAFHQGMMPVADLDFNGRLWMQRGPRGQFAVGNVLLPCPARSSIFTVLKN